MNRAKQSMKVKQLLALFVAIFMAMTVFVAPTAYAEDNGNQDDRIRYQFSGGWMIFEKSTGTILNCEREVAGSVTIPATIEDTPVINIGNYAFGGDHIRKIVIPKSITHIAETAFDNCWRLNSINVDAENPNYVSINGVLIDQNTSTLITCPRYLAKDSLNVPDNVTRIREKAFRYCENLKRIILPEGLVTIGKRAFYGTWGLTQINIPSNVREIGEEAFSHSGYLAAINVDPKNSNYASLDGVLFTKDKSHLIRFPMNKRSEQHSYTIPNTVKRIEKYAFWECPEENITIPNSVISIGESAFANCGLKEIVIPNSVTNIEKHAVGYFYRRDDHKDIPKKVPGFTIYGYSKTSEAAKYASKNGFKYVNMNSESFKKKPQTISCTSNFNKVYGNSSFNLKAATSGDGALSYKSGNTAVASVSSKGIVTVKGTGKTNITITAQATKLYKEATKKVTITVEPKKMASFTVTSSRAGSLKVGWKKDSRATGYQVKIATNSSFTKGTETFTSTYNTTLSKIFTGLNKRDTYYVKVRAYKKVGSTKIYGDYSAVKKVKIK